MTTAFPGGLDNWTSPSSGTKMNASGFEHDLVHSNLFDAVEAIEAELGTNPKGAAASVGARFALYLPLTGGTLTGNLTIAPTTGQSRLDVNAADTGSEQPAQIALYRRGSLRWVVGKSQDSETGSSAGSNFAITRYNDSGIPFDSPITITRSTGRVDLPALTYIGGVQFVNPSGVYLPLTGGTLTGALTIAPTSADSLLTINAADVSSYREAKVYFNSRGVSRWIMGKSGETETGSNAGSNFDLSASADNGATLGLYLRFVRSTGAGSFYNPVYIEPNSADAYLNINTADAFNERSGALSFLRRGSARWSIQKTSASESGANAGSNFLIYRYDDAGAVIDAPLTITRSTGRVDLTALTVAPTTGNAISSINAADTGAERYAYLEIRRRGAVRWSTGKDSVAESGANAGSNFEIWRYSDAGSAIDTPFKITRSTGRVDLPALTYIGGVQFGSYLPITGGTLTGTLVVGPTTGNAISRINAVDTGTERPAYLEVDRRGLPRWTVGKDNGTESGANAGSDFKIERYNDAGSAIDSPLTITRSTGRVDLPALTYAGGDQVISVAARVPNVIYNGGMDVWQRGAGPFTTSAGYTADGWVMTNGSGATNQVDRLTIANGAIAGRGKYALQWARSVAGSATSTVDQRIEDVATFAGETVTISLEAWTSSGSVDFTLSLDQYFGSGGSPSSRVVGSLSSVKTATTAVATKFTFTTAVASISGKTRGTDGKDCLILLINRAFNSTNGATGTFYIRNVQIERGSNATPFEVLPYQEVLSRCQRYYVSLGGDYLYYNFGSGYELSTTQANVVVYYPVEMRTQPGMSYSNLSHFYVTDGTVNNTTLTTIAGDANASTRLSHNVVITSSSATLVASRPCLLRANNTTSARVNFTAEL